MPSLLELAQRRVLQNGMHPREAALMLEGFARGEGRDIDWGTIAPYLAPGLADRIDKAAVGYRMRNGVPSPAVPEPVVRDGKMLATGGN